VPRDLAHRGQHAFVEGRLAQLLARKVDLDSDDLDHVPPQDCEALRSSASWHALHSCWSWFARPASRDVLTQETECSPQLVRLTARHICMRGDYVRRPDLPSRGSGRSVWGVTRPVITGRGRSGNRRHALGRHAVSSVRSRWSPKLEAAGQNKILSNGDGLNFVLWIVPVASDRYSRASDSGDVRLPQIIDVARLEIECAAASR
jgi:hypothetical protein